MLRHLEMECHIFNNGAQVLSAYEKNGDDVDLILMDCEMPIMDGYDATREIRKRQQQFNRPDLPIIALTANIGVEFEQFARSAGMDDLITKPVRKQTLKNLFTTWLPDATDTSEITNDNSSER
jgi:CheY-like chemotaxis protein